MDPYCRIRVGHNVYETETAYNGAKNPTWGKTLYATLPVGVDTFTIEIFDEKSFKADERIAWSVIDIIPRIMNGETVDEWYSLSGKQGNQQEGQGKFHLNLQNVDRTLNLKRFHSKNSFFGWDLLYLEDNSPD